MDDFCLWQKFFQHPSFVGAGAATGEQSYTEDGYNCSLCIVPVFDFCGVKNIFNTARAGNRITQMMDTIVFSV